MITFKDGVIKVDNEILWVKKEFKQWLECVGEDFSCLNEIQFVMNEEPTISRIAIENLIKNGAPEELNFFCNKCIMRNEAKIKGPA